MADLWELGRLLETVLISGDASTQVNGVCCNSKQVAKGDIFVCVTGFSSDGHHFAQSAVDNGAVALVVEREPELTSPVPYIVVKNSRRALATLSAHFMGNPANKMLTIGITGTNGKTTVSYLVESVLKAGGVYDPGLLGTIEAHVAGQTRKLNNTTPESIDLHHMFKEMAEAGQNSVVMEVSSHALALDRVYGIPFDIAVFTNLTQDHLDFHGTMENYFATKARLFASLGTYSNRSVGPFAVINLDDPYAERLLEVVRGRVPHVTYGTGRNAEVHAYNVEVGPAGMSFILETRVDSQEVHMQLSGMFNLYNALAAAAVGTALRMNLETIVEGLEAVPAVPGRFQPVRAGQPFSVIVDYAHTPDGLQNVLHSARNITKGNLITVFGCGGDRDKGKRPIMGRLVAELSDVGIVTADNPRSELLEDINAQIMSGVPQEFMAKMSLEEDRAKAIALAISQAKPGDCVLIAGKGHEKVQKFADRVVPFDDVDVAEKALAKHPFVGSNTELTCSLQVSWDRTSWRREDYQVATKKQA